MTPEPKTHIMPAAAVPKRSLVRIPEDVYPDAGDFEIVKIEYGVPVAGKLTWHNPEGLEVMVSAIRKIHVLELP